MEFKLIILTLILLGIPLALFFYFNQRWELMQRKPIKKIGHVVGIAFCAIGAFGSVAVYGGGYFGGKINLTPFLPSVISFLLPVIFIFLGNKIMELSEIPLTYLDFDLLFSGYFERDDLTKPSNIEIIQPDTKNLKDLLPNILTKISSQKTILILDSLNGLYSFFDDQNPGRFVNSLIMLLHANAKFSQSILFITCLAKKKDDNWVLPTGRHILEFENINRFEINEDATKIEIKAI